MRRHSWLLIFTVISVQTVLNALAEFNDNISLKQLRLHDLEIEQNQKNYQRGQLKRLQQQQPPLQLPTSNVDSQRAFSDRSQNMQTSFRSITQSVRPLEQKNTKAKSQQSSGGDYVTTAGSDFNYGISPLDKNSIDTEASEADTDTDIVSYSHDEPPFHLRRQQLELLSAGGAGYALSSADVLVPPFANADFGHNFNEQHPPSQFPHGRYEYPFEVNKNRFPSSYLVNAANEDTANYLTNIDLPVTSAGTIEYASGYLPTNQLSSQRPLIQYGSPHADFRRPSIHSQSNQLSYAPIRSENEASTSRINIPYPPSFISITTRRPETGFDGSGAYVAVQPLGRSLGYGKTFRPSAVDPVPDFFSSRQSKSLLDSYIPSWIVTRMIEQQRDSVYPEPFSNNLPYKRYIKRADIAQARKDNFNNNFKTVNSKHIEDSRVVKKSLPVQRNFADEERKMTI